MIGYLRLKFRKNDHTDEAQFSQIKSCRDKDDSTKIIDNFDHKSVSYI